MRKLDNSELKMIYGGASISGTLINSFVRGINVFLDLGRALGNAVRRIIYHQICPL